MSETRSKFNQDIREGACAVRLVLETGKPFAVVARELGVNEGTLGMVTCDRHRRDGGDAALSEPERAEPAGCCGRWPSCGWSSMCLSVRSPSV
jgi:transposase